MGKLFMSGQFYKPKRKAHRRCGNFLWKGVFFWESKISIGCDIHVNKFGCVFQSGVASVQLRFFCCVCIYKQLVFFCCAYMCVGVVVCVLYCLWVMFFIVLMPMGVCKWASFLFISMSENVHYYVHNGTWQCHIVHIISSKYRYIW